MNRADAHDNRSLITARRTHASELEISQHSLRHLLAHSRASLTTSVSTKESEEAQRKRGGGKKCVSLLAPDGSPFGNADSMGRTRSINGVEC